MWKKANKSIDDKENEIKRKGQGIKTKSNLLAVN